MPTDCSANLFGFAPVAGRSVIASFDGGAMTSDAGALLLGAANKVLGLARRLAACFKDSRDPPYIEHTVETLVIQRITGIALGYEGLNDHDHLRHDPVMAVLVGKLEASRSTCTPLVEAVPYGHWKKSTFIGALRCDGMGAAGVVDGAINRELFLAWVEQVEVPPHHG